MGGIDRDGVGAEAGPGYALSWGGNIGALVDLLAQYDGYDKHDIYRDFPQFAKTFTAGTRLTILDYDTPSIGDAGAVGTIGKVQCAPAFIIRGYRYLRDPDIALAAFRENGLSAKGLGRDLTDADPEQFEREIDRIAEEKGAEAAQLGPHNMAGYGFLTLETGRKRNGTGVFMYYGRNAGHGHLDRLNMGIYGFGFDLTPDLGYPEFATSWPKRNEWTRQTIAHNTVVVNQTSQKTNWVGHPTLFKALPGIQCAEVESTDVYPGIRDYRRTLLFVPLSPETGYVIDIFRVEGGDDHLRSFHGPGVHVTADGLQLAGPEPGTLAGKEIPFGTSRRAAKGIGFSWLTRVARDPSPPSAWWLEWAVPPGYRGAAADDDLHLRMWDVSAADEVILADGEPPQNKSGNPRWLRYSLTRRTGSDLTSTFVSVIEPYRGMPSVVRVERLPIPDAPLHGGPVALSIELADGREHAIFYSPRADAPFTAGGVRFEGRIGFLSLRAGRVREAALIAGRTLVRKDFSLTSDRAQWEGTILAREQRRDGTSVVRVDTALPAGDALVGNEIIVANDRVRNACYSIRKVTPVDGGAEISLGRVSLVRSYVNTKDYGAGVSYNFDVGARFVIPNHASFQAR